MLKKSRPAYLPNLDSQQSAVRDHVSIVCHPAAAAALRCSVYYQSLLIILSTSCLQLLC